MSPAYRLAGVHIGFLVLCLPLILLWYFDGVEAGLGDASGRWAYVAVAVVYAAVVATGRPAAFYHGFSRLRVTRKAARILVASAALLVLSVVLDVGDTGRALGVAGIVGALALFLWAVAVALFGGTPSAETPR